MNLRYATVTGVARDDLPDEGAWLYAETVRQIHAQNPGTGVEILATDFSGNPDLLGEVFSSRPEVFAHNVETVPRIFKRIRPAFRYERSLDVSSPRPATPASSPSPTSSSAWARSAPRVSQALQDLHDAGTDIITITQYLRPTPRHLPVDRWVKPEEFVEIKDEAEEIGFLGVLVRAAGAFVLPRRPPVGAVDGASEGPRDPERHLRTHSASPPGILGFAQAVS